MVHGRGVREDLERGEVAGRAEAGGLEPVDADLLARGHRLGERQRLEVGVEPRTGDQSRGRGRPDLLGELGELAVVRGGEDALLDAELAQRDLQDLEVGDLVDHRLAPCGRGRGRGRGHGRGGRRGGGGGGRSCSVRARAGHGHPDPAQVAARSQCSGISVRSVSVAVPV